MNILFDCISLQKFIGGGSEYTYFFFNKLLERAKNNEIKLYGVYSSNLRLDFYEKFIGDFKIKLVDIEKSQLRDFIQKNKINTFFIGIAQRYYTYDLTNLPCRIVIVCHDVSELVLLYDKNFTSMARKKLEPIAHPRIQQIKEFIKYFIHFFIEKKYIKSIYEKHKNLEKLLQEKNVFVVTVSNYSKYSLLYYFNNIANPIRVYTPPHKISNEIGQYKPENTVLKHLVESKKKFFLLVSCTRFHKNAAIFVEQWKKFCQITNNMYYGVLLGDVQVKEENIITLPFLSGDDLEYAYQNSFCLVFASVAEGYGSPPMEAMKYSIPIVCSNVTSMPEIYGSSLVYFSPYYPEDLFRALLFIIEHYEEYKEKSKEKYNEILQKQLLDSKKLEDFIMYGN